MFANFEMKPRLKSEILENSSMVGVAPYRFNSKTTIQRRSGVFSSCVSRPGFRKNGLSLFFLFSRFSIIFTTVKILYFREIFVKGLYLPLGSLFFPTDLFEKVVITAVKDFRVAVLEQYQFRSHGTQNHFTVGNNDHGSFKILDGIDEGFNRL